MINNHITVLSWLERYIPEHAVDKIRCLPIPSAHDATDFHMTAVALPDWASDLAPTKEQVLYIPRHCLTKGSSDRWLRVDWLRACYDMLTSQAEYLFEQQQGPIHSYSYRLPNSFSPMFDHAWVNRIALFLRRWAAQHNELSEEEIFGPRPTGRIHLTHDVDYIDKTVALRIKQTIFSAVNLLRNITKAKPAAIKSDLIRLYRFALCGGSYWQMPAIHELEKKYGLTSQWNIYGGKGGWKRSLSKLLLDPGYQSSDPRLTAELASLHHEGHRIGLHQAFHSWNDSSSMSKERLNVEQSTGIPIHHCRQHWLRFSFKDTWPAQEAAGFQLDTTLGFNDRIGFRNGAAIHLPAWVHSENRASNTLHTLPMVLMDSHLFDYGQMNKDARRATINKFLDEIELTGGEATVIWHQRVFHPDYNWGEEYAYLLDQIVARGLT